MQRHPTMWRSAFAGQSPHRGHNLAELLDLLRSAGGRLSFSPSPNRPSLQPLLHCAASVLAPIDVIQLARELDLSLLERDQHGNTLLHAAIRGPCLCVSHVRSLLGFDVHK